MRYTLHDAAIPQDESGDDMAVTTFGSQRSLNRIQRVPSRIPISVGHKKKSDSTSEQPTRDKDGECAISRRVDVMYLKQIKNKIRSSYSCNQQHCPRMRERMERNRLQMHPPSLKSCSHSQNSYMDDQTETSTVIEKQRIGKASTKSGPDCAYINAIHADSIEINANNYFNNIKGNTDIQTSMRNDNKLDEIKSKYKLNYNESDDSIPLKRTDTRDVVMPKRNIYKDYVKMEVIEWFPEVPVYLGRRYNTDKDNLIDDLTERITNLSGECNQKYYDQKIISEISSTLDSMPLWYPGAKRYQRVFKDMLMNKLLHRIKYLNKKITSPDSKNSYKNVKHSITRTNNNYTTFDHKVEDEITQWMSFIKNRRISNIRNPVDKKEFVKTLIKRVTRLLHTHTNKNNLKSAIIDVMTSFRFGKYSGENGHIERFAEDLANRLLNIEAKLDHNSIHSNNNTALYRADRTLMLSNNNNEIVKTICKEINECLENIRITNRCDLIKDICDVIMDSYLAAPNEENSMKNEICNLLRTTLNLSEFMAFKIAQTLSQKVKNIIHGPNIESMTLPRRISVYTLSEERCFSMNCPATSTPKENKRRKSIPKLNPEETEYTAKVGNLIRAWMETLPGKICATEENDFKETMINDLAGEITDAAKLEQLASLDEKEKWLKYLVYKWLHKLDVFDLEEVSPQIDNLLLKIKDITVPILTRPQHGNRQAMANIQHLDRDSGWNEPFLPKAKDILEDEISIWINENSSDVIDTDKSIRNNNIGELAEVLQNKLSKNLPEQEILNDIAQWLRNIVKSNQINNVNDLAEKLKNRIINLPQDSTLIGNHDKKFKQKAEYLEEIRNPCCQPTEIQTNDNNTINIDKTMQQFIAKFIEHNYDVDDPLARGAFSHLLKTKLRRLNSPTRKQVYDFGTTETNKLFPQENLIKELEYIKDISDWLKNIPMQGNYNTVNNKERIDLVNNLAVNILRVEEKRDAEPDDMDYNIYMTSVISQFLVQLPIIEEYKNDRNIMFMTDQLIGKIISHQSKIQKTNEYLDKSGVNSQNIGDFIEEFIRLNGSEIANDEMKLEAWSVRLLKEIKKMARDSNMTLLSKDNVYNNLKNVPFSEAESLNEFDNELEYIKEVAEWLKNLPLLPINESDQEERIEMICKLTEKITEIKIKKSNVPDDGKAEAEFGEYISKWISDLSLDESREVIAAVVIQQLINRIERVTMKEKPKFDFMQIKEPFSSKDLDAQKLTKHQNSKTLKSAKSKQIKNPATVIVDAIENWSASLPIKVDSENTVKSIKNDTTMKLFQKVGELSVDPRTFNDDLLYKEILLDEVESILETLPQDTDLQNDKERLNSQLVQRIIEANVAIRESYAGELYRQKLEHVIEASFPHSVKAKHVDNPGFEIYKSHLANIFIIQNFDHGNDTLKLKYERRIQNNIDKFYESIKTKNVTLMSKDEINNELYSALYRVPVPNKSAVIEEVEEIKTRCEIEAWFAQLPLKETYEITELLQIHKILATLAKRIHEIEKSDIESPYNRIHKEIMKLIIKFPLNHEEEKNFEKYAKNLLDGLKLSKDNRKCIINDPSPKNAKNKRSKIKSDDKTQATGVKSARNVSENQLRLTKPKKNAAEIIIEGVETWCNQLPVHAITPQEEENAKTIKENISTKILIKISELIVNPNILNDDFLFDDLFDEELDKLLSALSTCCEFEETKTTRKMNLTYLINSVKPLLREEKARLQYKQDLAKTVAKVLKKSQDTTADKEAFFNNIQDKIVENFLQYDYDRANTEAIQVYKNKVQDAVVELYGNIDNKPDTLDPLMTRNQVMCELAKIKIPSKRFLKEEVEEIRMKSEVSKLFDELSLSDSNIEKQTLINLIKSNLATTLNHIESHGYNTHTENKMKQEVSKSLKKLKKNVKQKIIDSFIDKLKNNEMVRRAPPKEDTIDITLPNSCKMSEICGINGLIETSKTKTKRDDFANRSYNKTCTDQCQNKQRMVNDNLRKQTDVKNLTKVDKCECYTERPGSSRSPENIMEDSSPETSDNGKNTSHISDFDAKEDIGENICICDGMRRGRRPCFVPMGWYCNSHDDMPVCRTPPGFYYY